LAALVLEHEQEDNDDEDDDDDDVPVVYSEDDNPDYSDEEELQYSSLDLSDSESGPDVPSDDEQELPHSLLKTGQKNLQLKRFP
jgi:hypothetical protein